MAGNAGPAADERDWLTSPEHDRELAAAEKSVEAAVAKAAADPLRPAFHFHPAARFMNDPNGCVYHSGVYHMFYQHLPYWGEPNGPYVPGWGHATSRDMIRWKHEPIALMPVKGTYDEAGIASGACAVVGGHPTILYTSVPPQAQSLARTFDGGRTWRRYAHNPVIPRQPAMPGLEDGFRDPFVWREGREWRLVAGSGIKGVGGTVLMYRSRDFLKWEFVGPLATGMGPDCFQWECPNFFKLGDKWVLIVSPLLHSEPALRGMVQYSVGDYDGTRFEPGPWRPLDLGGPACFYAPNSLVDEHGRRILWGWLMGGGSPGSMWDGLLTMPRYLQLGPDDCLLLKPVRNVESLREERVARLRLRELKAGDLLDVAKGTQLDVEIGLGVSSGCVEVQVLASPDGKRGTTVRWDLRTGELRCGDHAGTIALGAKRDQSLRVIVDRSVIEVYAANREPMSLRAYPQPGDDAFRIRVAEGEVAEVAVNAWRMASIW